MDHPLQDDQQFGRALPATDRAAAMFSDRYGRAPIAASAPGRVNLIGEHTDYNDGFVMPMALPFRTAIAAEQTTPGSGVELTSEGYGTVRFDPSDPLAGSPAGGDWAIHLRGVHEVVRQAGIQVPDWRGTIATDIPRGASLSSSAALEVACLSVVLFLAGERWTEVEIALAGQRVENEVLGLPSGIMDQLISATATEGHASLIDCRSLTIDHRQLPDGVSVVIMDTGTRRELVDSEYAARRTSCETAAGVIGVGALRDAALEDLAALDGHPLAELLTARARHVISENERTLAAAKAMSSGDAARLGQLMTASHVSLRDDYEVSGPALDAIVDIALGAPGCLGARMTGGGFAGCAVALVESPAAQHFSADVSDRYRAAEGIEPTIWTVQPSRGLGLIFHF